MRDTISSIYTLNLQLNYFLIHSCAPEIIQCNIARMATNEVLTVDFSPFREASVTETNFDKSTDEQRRK